MESFEVRKKALFDCLNEAEGSLKGTHLDQSNKRVHESDIEQNDSGCGRKIIRLRGKESIFVKPDLPITKCLKPRKQPDYQVNPHRWTKYSLEDADISDRANSDAAFAFLREIESRKEDNEEADSNENEESTRVVFKKRIRTNQIEDTEAHASGDKPEMRGSKVVMPEYVVGQKPAKVRTSPAVKSVDTAKSKAVKLDHLFDE